MQSSAAGIAIGAYIHTRSQLLITLPRKEEKNRILQRVHAIRDRDSKCKCNNNWSLFCRREPPRGVARPFAWHFVNYAGCLGIKSKQGIQIWKLRNAALDVNESQHKLHAVRLLNYRFVQIQFRCSRALFQSVQTQLQRFAYDITSCMNTERCATYSAAQTQHRPIELEFYFHTHKDHCYCRGLRNRDTTKL